MQEAPILKTQITEYLPERPVIVEAGAHIGRDTEKMSHLWPQATIHAFEPVPALHEKLLERTVDLPNVICYNLALSDHVGTETIYVSSGASTAVSSLFKPHEYIKDRPNVAFAPDTVATTTLEQWAKDYGIDRVDFMWLYMQGAELKVLQVAPTILKTVRVIVLEASLTERFKDMPLLDELVAWIESQGFKVIQKDAPRHNKVNLLCVRPEFLT